MTNTYRKIALRKIALLTGATRSIGRATSLALAKASVRVMIHYERSASEANALQKQIETDGGDADTVSADSPHRKT